MHLLKYKRILLKLSGEALVGKQSYGIDHETLFRYAEQIKEIWEMGTEIAIVVGGGNILDRKSVV
jgi:uridylate kinase